MNIILVGKIKGKPVRCQIGGRGPMLACFSGMLVLALAIAGIGYWLGTTQGKIMQLAQLEQEIRQQKKMIEEARAAARSDLDALASRIGSMQANVTRVNALGKVVVKLARLDAREFDFDNEPAYGGPQTPDTGVAMQFDEVLHDLDQQLQSRTEQLTVLQDVLMSKMLQLESKPTGRPIDKGWISSYYGKRTDPFSGKLEMHKGLDFASRAGTPVKAVASGVVTWAGKRYGYGNLVEINHGNGYTTRYGHNEKILVEVGDAVKKGDPISLMGSTGRSTGPHVHFEVLLRDRQVDPLRFVQARS